MHVVKWFQATEDFGDFKTGRLFKVTGDESDFEQFKKKPVKEVTQEEVDTIRYLPKKTMPE